MFDCWGRVWRWRQFFCLVGWSREARLEDENFSSINQWRVFQSPWRLWQIFPLSMKKGRKEESRNNWNLNKNAEAYQLFTPQRMHVRKGKSLLFDCEKKRDRTKVAREKENKSFIWFLAYLSLAISNHYQIFIRNWEVNNSNVRFQEWKSGKAQSNGVLIEDFTRSNFRLRELSSENYD